MEDRHRDLLEREIMTLSKELDLPPVLLFLRQLQILQEWHYHEIMAKPTPLEQRVAFVTLIKTRGPRAFAGLYQAIYHARQDHLCSLLEPELDDEQKLPPRECQPYITYPPSGPGSIPGPPDSTPAIGSEVPRVPVMGPEPPKAIMAPSPAAVARSQEYYQGYDYIRMMQTAAELENLHVNNLDSLPAVLNNNHPFDDKEVYPNFTQPKGLCIIFNNRRFEKGVLPERHGTDVDAANLKKLFTQLGYDVKIKHDHTARDMRDAMARFSLKDHSRYDSAIVVVLTHGLHGELYGTCGTLVRVEDLTASLDSQHCRKLMGKPKLFFLQACRGEAYDEGVPHSDAGHETDGQCLGKGERMEQDGLDPLDIVLELNAKDEADAQYLKKKPLEADMLIAYATTPGYVSWRNSARGSWFVQAICEIFAEHAKDQDINVLLTKVNRRVVEAFTASSGQGYKQQPDFHNRLHRQFFFFPGLQRHPRQ